MEFNREQEEFRCKKYLLFIKIAFSCVVFAVCSVFLGLEYGNRDIWLYAFGNVTQFMFTLGGKTYGLHKSEKKKDNDNVSINLENIDFIDGAARDQLPNLTYEYRVRNVTPENGK